LASTPSSRSICDNITDNHHSYVKSTQRGGRAVDYLIYADCSEHKTNTLVGTIGYAFAGVRLNRPMFSFFQIDQVKSGTRSVEQSRRIAVCFRYTLVKDMPKNFASQALSISLRLLKREWKSKYEADLVGVFTMVMPPWKGTCFKAANFQFIGETSGAEIMTHSTNHKKNAIMAGKNLRILAYRYGWKEKER